MKKTPLLQLERLGQSIWLDLLGRDLMLSGELTRLIEEDGLSGVTSNPAIFEKDMTQSATYDGRIRELALAGKGAEEKALNGLAALGIDLAHVTQALEDEGIEKFVKPYDNLLARLAEKRDALLCEAGGAR